MLCFSTGWIEHLIIQVVLLVATIAIIRLLVPWLLNLVGVTSGPLMQAINIALWACVVIFVIVLCFDLFSCLLGSGGYRPL